MKKIISKRIFKEKYFNKLINQTITRKLIKRSSTYNLHRKNPIVIFANDEIGININTFGTYEKEEINDLLVLLKNINIKTINCTAIDIGANIGNHSIEFSKYFKKVISFEPNPRVFNLLRLNTEYINNIEIYNLGCGIEEKNKILFENYDNIGSSSTKYLANKKNPINIKIKPLDNYFDQLNNLKLIKIDVEGMEFEVIKGAKKIIEYFKPVICFEQHEEEFLDSNETKSINLLRSQGYKIFTLNKDKKTNFFYRIFDIFKNILFGIDEKREIIESIKLSRDTYGVFAIHKSTLEDLNF